MDILKRTQNASLMEWLPQTAGHQMISFPAMFVNVLLAAHIGQDFPL